MPRPDSCARQTCWSVVLKSLVWNATCPALFKPPRRTIEKKWFWPASTAFSPVTATTSAIGSLPWKMPERPGTFVASNTTAPELLIATLPKFEKPSVAAAIVVNVNGLPKAVGVETCTPAGTASVLVGTPPPSGRLKY